MRLLVCLLQMVRDFVVTTACLAAACAIVNMGCSQTCLTPGSSRVTVHHTKHTTGVTLGLGNSSSLQRLQRASCCFPTPISNPPHCAAGHHEAGPPQRRHRHCGCFRRQAFEEVSIARCALCVPAYQPSGTVTGLVVGSQGMMQVSAATLACNSCVAPAVTPAGWPGRHSSIIRRAAGDDEAAASPAAAPQQPQQPAAVSVAEQQPTPSSSVTSSMEGTTKRKARVGGDSTDPVASFLSRRFG